MGEKTRDDLTAPHVFDARPVGTGGICALSVSAGSPGPCAHERMCANVNDVREVAAIVHPDPREGITVVTFVFRVAEDSRAGFSGVERERGWGAWSGMREAGNEPGRDLPECITPRRW